MTVLSEELKLYMSGLNDKYSELLNQVYQKAYNDIEAVDRTLTSKTFGGSVHIGNIFGTTNNLFKKTKDKDKDIDIMKDISEEQRLLLGCAILLHDVGRSQHNKNHAIASADLIINNWREYGLPDEQFADTIAEIVESHDKTDSNIADNTCFIEYYEKEIKFGICCIILRLVDELDCTYKRTHATMEDNFKIVRLRKCTTAVQFDFENKLIKIHIKPKDICIWNWVPIYEGYLNFIFDEVIIKSALFNYYSHIKVLRKKVKLQKVSFWTKLIDLDKFENIYISFIFGIVGKNNQPGYRTQDAWRGSPYSIWDIKTLTSMMTMAQSINPNIRVEIEHVVMDSNISTQLSIYEKILEKANTIIVGSPKMNALCEIILAKALNVKPFSYDDFKSRKLIRFSWPKADLNFKKINKIPYSTFLYEPSKKNEIGIYNCTADEYEPEPLAVFEIPDNDTEEKPDGGLIIIVKYYGNYHMVLSGISGPGTLASSYSLCDCSKCYILENNDIMDHLENNQAIFVLIKASVTKNEDAFENRNIKNFDITKAWYFDSSKSSLEDIQLKQL